MRITEEQIALIRSLHCERLALTSQLASWLHDKRAAHLVRHSFERQILTRIFQIRLGYEDANDWLIT